MYRHRDGWRIEFVENGRRRTKYFSDKKAAAKEEFERKHGLYEGPDNRANPTFAEFAERWMAEHCRTQKAPTQWSKDESRLKYHLLPTLGAVKLRQLRKAHFTQLKAALAAMPKGGGKKGTISAKTANLSLGLAKRIMVHAVDHELIPTNPAAGVKKFKETKPTLDFWALEERDQFLEHAHKVDPSFADLCEVACHTGLRIGELAFIRHCDLDFDRRKIKIVGSFSLEHDRPGPPKGGKENEIPMNETVLKVLAPCRFRKDETRVFPRELFRYAGYCCDRVKELATEAGVRPIRFHDLRHTFASNLAIAGVDLMQIQKLLTHASYQMTLRYARLRPDHLDGATDALVTHKSPHKTAILAKSGAPRGT